MRMSHIRNCYGAPAFLVLRRKQGAINYVNRKKEKRKKQKKTLFVIGKKEKERQTNETQTNNQRERERGGGIHFIPVLQQ